MQIIAIIILTLALLSFKHGAIGTCSSLAAMLLIIFLANRLSHVRNKQRSDE